MDEPLDIKPYKIYPATRSFIDSLKTYSRKPKTWNAPCGGCEFCQEDGYCSSIESEEDYGEGM